MAPHQERVVTEKRELDEKLTKLTDFIDNSPIYKTLPSAEQDRLGQQHMHMVAYSTVLGERIAAF